jgi:hypothetical protein
MSVGDNYMNSDELADAFRDLFDQLHAKIEAHPAGPLKHRAEVLANVAHRALERLKKHAVDDGIVQPFSGGEEKPDNGG